MSCDDGADDLGSTIRVARRALGLTQVVLAGRAGISPSYLSRIESSSWLSGGPWPSDSVLRALSRSLNLSSTELIRRREEERQRANGGASSPAPRGNGRTPYSVSIGDEEVHRAARRLVEQSPPRGSLRVTEILLHEQPPPAMRKGHIEYWDALGAKLAEDPGAILYRVCAATAGHFPLIRSKTEHLRAGRDPKAVGNIRTRFCYGNPLVIDVLISEHQTLIGIPDRRGHPYLRACVIVDDPDFASAARAWYDEYVWESTCSCADVRYPTAPESLDAIEASLPIGN